MIKNFDSLKQMSRIAYAISHGAPTDADSTCPHCGKPTLIFSFAVSVPPAYGLYIKCQSCEVIQHYTLDQKPPNFKPELVKPEFQALEDEAIRLAAGHPKESE